MTFKKHIAFISVALAVLFFGMTFDPTIEGEIMEVHKSEISHRQEVWISALEWCESRGDPSAVNPMDLDGTPSFGSFQFKETTFDQFTTAYELPEKDIMDRDAQYAIVVRMLSDPSVRWDRQFPACVRLLGQPPR